MARIDVHVSDAQKKTARAIANKTGYSVSDFIRIILDNFDPEKEVIAAENKNKNKDKNKSQSSLYWMDENNIYIDYSRLRKNGELPVDFDDAHTKQLYVINRKPLGQSVIDSLNKISEKKDERYERETNILSNGVYLSNLLQNIGENVNQIAHVLNKNKNNLDDKFNFNSLNKTVNEINNQSEKYLAALKDYLSDLLDEK